MTDWLDGRQDEPFSQDERSVLCHLGRHPSTSVEGPVGRVEPQAFLARLGARSGRLPVHFHPVDQFQVFVHGEATVGGHPVGKASVHYADRFQPYGPIDPGPEGVSFLTLRGVSDAGAHYMPDSREGLAAGLDAVPEPIDRRRNLTIELDTVAAGPEWTDAEADDDGMAVRVVGVPASRPMHPVGVGGAGAYLVVVDGAIAADGRHRGSGSLRWVAPGADTGQVMAGVQGARVVLVQLPERLPITGVASPR